MRIGIVCQEYPPAVAEGGISHYTQCLVNNLSKTGDEIVIITGDGYIGNGADGPISVLKFPGKFRRKTVSYVIEQFKALGVDIVNLQYSPVMYPALFKFAWRYLKKNFLATVSFHTLWGGSKINYLTAFSLLKSAHGIIATNSEIMYLLKKYLPCFQKKTRFIPIGSNIAPTHNSEALNRLFVKYPLNPDSLVLAYFGMCYPGKGIDLLFESTRILLEHYKLNIQLLVIGGGISDVPEYVSEKRRLTATLGLENNVIWTGRIPAQEVSALLTRSHLVVLPYDSGVSDRRGSLMAALAHHKAIITTEPAVPVPFFRNGVNMVWPAANDPGSLAKTTFYVLYNDELRKKLERGAADLSRHYQWPKIAEQTQGFFMDIISKKNLNRKVSIN